MAGISRIIDIDNEVIRLIVIVILLDIVIHSAISDDKSYASVFGVAYWGMPREHIVEKEGIPDIMDDNMGALWYFNKTFMGKAVEIVYNFGQGCSAMKSSTCLFSDGYYVFKDVSSAYFDELDKKLTEKYGHPVSVTKSSEGQAGSYYVVKGNKEIEHTTRIRIHEGVKIMHTYSENLYEYTDFSGALHSPGPVANIVHYYAPDYGGKGLGLK